MQTLSYFPGQIATIFLEVTDGYSNVRIDSTVIPSVAQIIFPDLSIAPSYPQNMTRLGVGLYTFHFTLPSGAAAVGSYLIDVKYRNPQNAGGNSGDDIASAAYQIIVTAPFGNFAVTIG